MTKEEIKEYLEIGKVPIDAFYTQGAEAGKHIALKCVICGCVLLRLPSCPHPVLCSDRCCDTYSAIVEKDRINKDLCVSAFYAKDEKKGFLRKIFGE